MSLTVFHIPVCPFSQRLEILLALKGKTDAVRFDVVDVTKPRPPTLLAKTRGATALPVLELEDGKVLTESLVLMQYLEQRFPDPPVAERDPYRRAVESLLTLQERDFVATGYKMVLNQEPSLRDDWTQRLLERYAALDAFLVAHSTGDTFLFEAFGWAEAVFTPLFMRFWFLEYYEGFELPDEPRFARVRRWRDACLAHPAAQQVTKEQLVKVYYDYAKGVGNGALLPGRRVSSFSFEPHWSARPWPPADKYTVSASDAELGLTP
jgi:glutathione S-transferase